MATSQDSVSCAYIPLFLCLTSGAGAAFLLLEDARTHGPTFLNTALPLILVLGTIGAAIMAHLETRAVLKFLFAVAAVFGSVTTIYGSVSRVADVGEERTRDKRATNLTYEEKKDQLKEAKAEEKKECTYQGKECDKRRLRVKNLTEELVGLAPVSIHPVVDRMYEVTGVNKEALQRVFKLCDLLLMPLFLELVSIVSGAATLRKTVKQVLVVTKASDASVVRTYTKQEAWEDLQRLRSSGSDQFLIERWGVPAPTISKWMREWREANMVERQREGKQVITLLPPPKRRKVYR